MSLARGKGFMNKRGLPHGPRESSSSTCLLSEPGWKYTQLGWGQLAASEAQAWGVIPKLPRGESQVGHLQGSSEMPGLSSKGTLEAVPSNAS